MHSHSPDFLQKSSNSTAHTHTHIHKWNTHLASICTGCAYTNEEKYCTYVRTVAHFSNKMQDAKRTAHDTYNSNSNNKNELNFRGSGYFPTTVHSQLTTCMVLPSVLLKYYQGSKFISPKKYVASMWFGAFLSCLTSEKLQTRVALWLSVIPKQ